MHRSGTSLVAAMLAELGVFMGRDTHLPAGGRASEDSGARSAGYGESGAFYRLNERLLARAGATWYRIEPFLRRRPQARFAFDSGLMLQLATFLSLRTGYLGPLARMAAPAPRGWGWKDPRNSLTLPYWLRLFPDSRVVHVLRDPEAVADSLHRRAGAWQAAAELAPQPSSAAQAKAVLRHPRRSLRNLVGRNPLGLAAASEPDPCLSRSYCLALAGQYVAECLSYRALGARYLELPYEELVSSPTPAVAELAAHLQSRPDATELARAAGLVTAARPSG